MKLRVPFKPSLTLALLLTAAVLSTMAILLLSRTDSLVNRDLYDFGLRFSIEWADKYAAYYSAVVTSSAASVALTTAALLFIIAYTHKKEKALKLGSIFFLTPAIATTVLAMAFFLNLDQLVHTDLYQYGLQYSDQWAISYWTNARTLLSLQAASATLTTTSTTLIALSIPHQINTQPTKLLSIAMTLSGILALITATAYNSQILAFIGLGLTFWGAILTYIRKEDYVKKAVLDAATEPSLLTTIQIIKDLGYAGKAVHLPPRYLKNHEDNRLCILKQQSDKLPTPEQIQMHEDKILATDLQAILITPPGAELTKLFEKTLDTNFTKQDLTYVQQNLPKLLIEDLEIAENANIEPAGNTIRITLENTIFGTAQTEDAKSPDALPLLGSPLSSAIACVLAKATGKPIIINREQTSENGKTISIEYSLLEEKQEEPNQ